MQARIAGYFVFDFCYHTDCRAFFKIRDPFIDGLLLGDLGAQKEQIVRRERTGRAQNLATWSS